MTAAISWGAQPALAMPGQVHAACTEEEELNYIKENRISQKKQANKPKQTGCNHFWLDFLLTLPPLLTMIPPSVTPITCSRASCKNKEQEKAS